MILILSILDAKTVVNPPQVISFSTIEAEFTCFETCNYEYGHEILSLDYIFWEVLKTTKYILSQ